MESAFKLADNEKKMKYISVGEFAEKYGISERTARNYCATGKISKEYMAHGHVPFIITDDLKMFYYRGLQQWPNIKGYLRDTCLTAQDRYKVLLEYYRIDH